MFIPIQDLPDPVVGVTATGTIHADDHTGTLIPGEVRSFPYADLDVATSWVIG